MYLEGYKRLILAVVFITVTCIVVTTSSCSKEKTTTDKSKKEMIHSGPGPIMDVDKNKASLDQSGVDSNDPEYLAVLGDKYFERKRFAEAIVVYEKALKLNPYDIRTYNDLGLAYHYAGRSDMAVNKLREGTEVMPSYQRIWLSLGFVLLASGKGEEAKEPLKKAVELNPHSNVGIEAKTMLGRLK